MVQLKPEKRALEQLTRISEHFKAAKTIKQELDEVYLEMAIANNLPLRHGENKYVKNMYTALDRKYKVISMFFFIYICSHRIIVE